MATKQQHKKWNTHKKERQRLALAGMLPPSGWRVCPVCGTEYPEFRGVFQVRTCSIFMGSGCAPKSRSQGNIAAAGTRKAGDKAGFDNFRLRHCTRDGKQCGRYSKCCGFFGFVPGCDGTGYVRPEGVTAGSKAINYGCNVMSGNRRSVCHSSEA